MLSAQDLAYITATVQSALDTSVPHYHKTGTTQDGYGHTIPTYPGTPTDTVSVNIIKPSATQLTLYAGIIGSKQALILRAMQTSNISEGDKIVYDGLNWIVNNVQDAESYTVTKEYLITTIT